MFTHPDGQVTSVSFSNRHDQDKLCFSCPATENVLLAQEAVTGEKSLRLILTHDVKLVDHQQLRDFLLHHHLPQKLQHNDDT